MLHLTAIYTLGKYGKHRPLSLHPSTSSPGKNLVLSTHCSILLYVNAYDVYPAIATCVFSVVNLIGVTNDATCFKCCITHLLESAVMQDW